MFQFCLCYLDEVNVVLSAGQLGDLVVPPFQVSDFMGQALHVALGAVERRSLVGRYQLGHLLLHPLDGAHHVAEHLLAILQCPLGRVLHASRRRVSPKSSGCHTSKQAQLKNLITPIGTLSVLDDVILWSKFGRSSLISQIDGGVTNFERVYCML